MSCMKENVLCEASVSDVDPLSIISSSDTIKVSFSDSEDCTAHLCNINVFLVG